MSVLSETHEANRAAYVARVVERIAGYVGSDVERLADTTDEQLAGFCRLLGERQPSPETCAAIRRAVVERNENSRSDFDIIRRALNILSGAVGRRDFGSPLVAEADDALAALDRIERRG